MADWLTTEEADAYFARRLNSSSYWNSSADKTGALATAQWQIENCGEFGSFDEPASGEDYSQAMKDAVCEQAAFLLRQGPDAEIRADLIAQGVTQAGVVKEAYNTIVAGRGNDRVVICETARSTLKNAGYGKYGLGFRYENPE